MGLRELLFGPPAFEPASYVPDAPQVDFTRPPTHGFQLDATFSSIQGESTLLSQIAGQFTDAEVSRAFALSVPAVLRARNLISSTAASLPICLRRQDRTEDTRAWLGRDPSQNVEHTALYALTFEDLWLHGRSYWQITSRDSQGYPLTAEHINFPFVSEAYGYEYASYYINEDQPFDPSMDDIRINGVRSSDVIRFISPNPPFLKYAARAIRTYTALDVAASTLSGSPVPIGWFEDDPTYPPMDDDEVQAFVSAWNAARSKSTWGYIPQGIKLQQLQTFNPEQLQLTNLRNQAALDIARAAGVDPDYLGIPQTTRTYANSENRRSDLIDFTLAPYLSAVADRLSRGDITPRGLRVSFDIDAFERSDMSTRFNAYNVAKAAGFLTVNEIRAKEGLPELDESELPQPPAPQIGNADGTIPSV